MLDKKEFRRKYFLRLASSPLTLLPVVGGATLIAIAWALGLGDVSIFLGFAGVAGGSGSFLQRLFAGSDRIRREVLEEIEREAEKRLDADLDALHAKLEKDGDPRTGSLLEDLRELLDAFKSDHKWQERIGTATSLSILGMVEELFDRSIQYLERSLELDRVGKRLTATEAQKGINERREKLIAQVTENVVRLGKTLANVQVMGLDREGLSDDLKRLNEELEITLQAARNADQLVAGLPENDLKEYERWGNDALPEE